MMERKYEKKEWSKMYQDRAYQLLKEKEDPASSRLRRDLQIITKAGTLIARKIGKRVRIKLKNKAFSCHRTPENLTFPKNLTDWKTSWGTQLICSICGAPAMYDCTACKTCNGIAHRLCVAEQLVMMRNVSMMSSLSIGSSSFAEASETKHADYEDVDGGDDGNGSDDQGGEDDAEDAIFGDGQEGEDNFQATIRALGADEYNCTECQRGYQEDVDYYEKLKVQLTYDRRLVLAMRLICRRILGCIERRRFKKLKRGLILIQSGIRKRRAKRVFFHWRRSQLRVVAIELMHLPLTTLSYGDLVVVTAVDPMKNQQLFRFDKEANRAMEDGFLIPGITSHMTIVISLCRVEEHTANTVYIIQDQCQLSLRDIDVFLEKLPYALSFGKRIWWHPTDPKKDFPYRVVDKPTGGIVAAHASSFSHHAHGSVENAVGSRSESKSHGGNTHYGHSGSKPGSPTSEFKTEGRAQSPMICSKPGSPQAPEHKASSDSRSNSPAAGLRRMSTMNAMSMGTGKHTQAQNQPQTQVPVAFSDKSEHFVRVLYSPQNPISSMVMMISGPPLDVLRAKAETDILAQARNKKKSGSDDSAAKGATRDQGPQGRATRWWLCLCNLRLYFYQNYGDNRPRLVSEIVDARVIVDPTYTKGNVISILHRDTRLWMLEMGDAKVAEKFAFAVSESQKAHAQRHGSIFIRTSEIRKKPSYGFDMEVC